MKKITLTFLSLGIAAQVLTSCSSDKKDGIHVDSSSTTVITETTKPGTAKTENGPAGYKVTATPDSAILGKENEALVKINDINVVELVDAEGKSTGSELSMKLTLTNKSTLEKKKFFTVQYSEARLELDNKSLIPAETNTGASNPDPESSTQDEWKFKLPANTKPVKLNFFLEGTRVSVNLAAQR